MSIDQTAIGESSGERNRFSFLHSRWTKYKQILAEFRSLIGSGQQCRIRTDCIGVVDDTDGHNICTLRCVSMPQLESVDRIVTAGIIAKAA